MSLYSFTSRLRLGKVVPAAAVAPCFILGLSCSDDEPIGPEQGPAELILVSGGDQTGIVGEDLPDPIVVELRISETGEPLRSRPVSVTVESGMGSISRPNGGGAAGDGATSNDMTDASGQVTFTAGLGPEPGLHVFSVHTSVPVTGDSIIEVRAFGEPGSVERVVKSGDGQVGAAGSVLPVPIAVLVSDRFGNPVDGLEVSFEVVMGGGVVTEDVVETDFFGSAAVEWMLGAGAGEQIVAAVVTSVGTFQFDALAQ